MHARTLLLLTEAGVLFRHRAVPVHLFLAACSDLRRAQGIGDGLAAATKAAAAGTGPRRPLDDAGKQSIQRGRGLSQALFPAVAPAVGLCAGAFRTEESAATASSGLCVSE